MTIGDARIFTTGGSGIDEFLPSNRSSADEVMDMLHTTEE